MLKCYNRRRVNVRAVAGFDYSILRVLFTFFLSADAIDGCDSFLPITKISDLCYSMGEAYR